MKYDRRNFKYNKNNYVIAYNWSLHNIDFDCYTSAQYQGIIYFDSWELCKKTIEEAGEDNIKKYLFEVMDNE